MFSLYRLLFRSGFWRILGRRSSWIEAARSARRVHKDKRARKHLLGFALLLMIPVLCLAYALWLMGTGAILLVPFVVPVLIWREWRAKGDAEPLTIVPTQKLEIKELPEESVREIRLYFERLALCFAVILDRAGSESFLKTKILPEGFIPTTRRGHLDLLQNHGIWDMMPIEDRMAVMAADGHWSIEQIHEARRTMEPLRLLRWILRVDYFLPALGQQLNWSYEIAYELVHEPAKLSKAPKTVNREDILVGRDAAQHLYYRCMAEQIHRGRLVPRDTEAIEWARGITERLGGNQDEDFVLGTQLVAEVSDEVLDWATRLSKQRMDFLNWAMGVLNGEPLPNTMTPVFYSIPADVEQSNEEKVVR